MGIWEETAIHLAPSGIAELRTDRVKSVPKGEPQRLKVARRNVAMADLFSEQSAPEILHRLCRFIYVKGNVTWYVIEEPPCVRTVTWSFLNYDWEKIEKRGLIRKLGLDPKKDSQRTRFQFAFPYTIFLLPISKYDEGVTLGMSFVAFRSEPLRSINDELFWAPFSNQRSTTGEMCLGSSKPTNAKTPCALIDLLVAHWWESNFNNHWVERYMEYQERIPELITPWEWEYYSKRRPAWVLDADWVRMGMTVAQKLGAVDKENRLLFAELARKAKSVPEVIPGKTPVGKTDKNSQDNSIQAILLQNGQTLQIGDKLICHTHTGGSFRSGDTCEVHKFVSYGRGVNIDLNKSGAYISDAHLLDYFRTAVQDPTTVFQVGSHQIGTGTNFTLVNQDDITTLRPGTYTITSLIVDHEGDAKVKLQGLSGWIYITNERVLFPSIKLNIPELKDDTFTYGQFSLKVGATVKITGVASQINGRLLHVESITQEKDSYFVKFAEREERFSIFRDNILTLGWEETVYEFSDKCLKFGRNKVLDLTTSTHLLVTEQGLPLNFGRVYETVGFVHPEGKHPLDVDLIIVNGNEPVPVIRNSAWVFSAHYELVTTTYTDDALTLQSGEPLTCQLDMRDYGFKEGEDVTILCFGKSKRVSNYTDVIFTDGRVICLTKEGIKYFVRKNGIKWEESETLRLPPNWLSSDIRFKNTPVQMNGIPTLLQQAIASRNTINGFGTFVGKDANGQPVNVGDVVKIQNICSDDGNGHLHNEHVDRHALVVHQCSAADNSIYAYLFLGVSVCNENINIKKTTSGFDGLDPAYQTETRRRQMALNFPKFLEKLSYEETNTATITVKSLVRIRPDVNPKYGRGNVQTNEVGRVLKLLKDGETVVDFPGEREWIGQIEEIELCPFESGQHVEIKPKVKPRFMLGKAQPGETGTFKELLTNGVVVVDFPNHPNWYGDVSDIQPSGTPKK